MGRQQFEDQFKNKLEHREIKPSAGSWDQLSKRLDSSDKKASPIFWWIGIAATIVGGVLIYSLAFNFDPGVESPGIVDGPSEKVFQEKADPAQENTLVAIEEDKQDENSEKEKISEKETTFSVENNKPAEILKPVLQEKSEAQMASAQIIDVPEDNAEIPSSPGTAEEALINPKLEELIAGISTNEKGDATDAEIDALLYKAAGEISLEQNRESLSGTIDSGDLLFDVEMELEQSFRDKVFDLLKEGYTKAKTAVANRT